MRIINMYNLKKLKKPRIVFGISLIVLIVIGSIYLPYTWVKADKETSENALKVAKTAKSGILQGALEKLRASPRDIEDPVYNDIKDGLKKVVEVNSDIHYAYIYTQKHEKLYFMVDSEEVGTEIYFPSGEEYTEAGEDYKKPFRDGEPLVTGPETNRRGTWISILIPFKNTQTGKIFAVLSVDYSANTWNNYAIYQTSLAGVIVFTLFLLLFAFFRLLIKAEDLLKAKEEAEIASVTKGQFLANMSHEIRTPINGIIGFLQLLKHTELDEIQKEYVREGISSSEVLLCLINDILDFSKIEAGKLSIEKIKFNLRAAVEDAVSTFTPKANEKRVFLYSFIKSNVPEEVLGDPARLRQILNNLMSNAVKFTSKGEIAVNIEGIEEFNNIATIRFTVTDTGIGISKDAIKKLFKPFTQEDSSTTRKFGGTGLGLSISKELVNMMGGDIGVESVQGKGSTFFFTAKFEIISTNSKVINANFKKLDNMKVLIVDDNKSNQMITRNYLEEFGAQVLEAENGEGAISELLKYANTDNQVEVVISDFQMAEMNGYELASAIKALPSIKNTRLILFTSVSQKGDVSIAKEKGFDAYLSKPVKRDELIGCVMIVTGMKQEPDSNETIVTKYTKKEVEMAHMLKILLAEDNVTNQKVVVAMLKNKGLTCDIAENGNEAYQACLKKDYDIVFMDCQMPVMDGYEATSKIRSAETGSKHTKIIAMTANAMEGDKEKCLKAGMDDYISKPINFEIMFKILEENTPRVVEQKPYLGFVDNSLKVFVEKSGIALNDAQEIFNEYINSLPEMLKKIEEAIVSDDFENLRAKAHQLKGSSGNLRINEIYELAIKLEEAAKIKDKSKCEEVFLEIKKLYE